MRRKKQKSPNVSTSGYMFHSGLEQRCVLLYLKNLIMSSFSVHKATEIYLFASDVFGKDTIEDIAEVIPREEINDSARRARKTKKLKEDPLEVCSVKTVARVLEKNIFPMIEKCLQNLPRHEKTEEEKRIKILQKALNLTAEEIELITFLYMIPTCQLVDKYLNRDEVADFSRLSIMQRYGDTLLGLEKGSIYKIFSQGNLYRYKLVERNGRDIASLYLEGWTLSYLFGEGPRSLEVAFFKKVTDATLNMEDFELSPEERHVLDIVLKSKGGTNILFYGRPGTGKTSFVKTLAKYYEKDLLSVTFPEDNDYSNRIRALHATINMTDPKRSIILVDEADDVLNSQESQYFKSRSSKSWINNLMEGHNQKIVWITNRVSEIDPSTMRRFTFSVEFKKFNPGNRIKLLTDELARRGLADYFTNEEMIKIANAYDVNADGIVKAIQLLKGRKKIKKEITMNCLQTILKNHEKATSGKDKTMMPKKDFEHYSIHGLNTSLDLDVLLKTVQRYLKLTEGCETKDQPAMTVLLHGLPGTGKSEFVYYLGYALGREICLRRCSDIQSKWVGETEKNIANAFRESAGDGSILFFDEADSFLFPRNQAFRSWEKNFTNEILTQMENHQGIVIFATNEIQGLDHAALRRFRYKVEFLPLTSEGNLHFYQTLLGPLVSDECFLTYEERDRLQMINKLTPGDFAVVRNQYLLADVCAINHAQLIHALYNEVKYKKNERRVIGFHG